MRARWKSRRVTIGCSYRKRFWRGIWDSCSLEDAMSSIMGVCVMKRRKEKWELKREEKEEQFIRLCMLQECDEKSMIKCLSEVCESFCLCAEMLRWLILLKNCYVHLFPLLYSLKWLIIDHLLSVSLPIKFGIGTDPVLMKLIVDCRVLSLPTLKLAWNYCCQTFCLYFIPSLKL